MFHVPGTMVAYSMADRCPTCGSPMVLSDDCKTCSCKVCGSKPIKRNLPKQEVRIVGGFGDGEPPKPKRRRPRKDVVND